MTVTAAAAAAVATPALSAAPPAPRPKKKPTAKPRARPPARPAPAKEVPEAAKTVTDELEHIVLQDSEDEKLVAEARQRIAEVHKKSLEQKGWSDKERAEAQVRAEARRDAKKA